MGAVLKAVANPVGTIVDAVVPKFRPPEQSLVTRGPEVAPAPPPQGGGFLGSLMGNFNAPPPRRDFRAPPPESPSEWQYAQGQGPVWSGPKRGNTI